MIKKLFTTDKLPSVWLRQGQDQGHTAGERMYFTGDTIYSYGSHFPIAKLFDAPNGERVILFTTRSHSVTTSKHIHAVRLALSHSSRRVVYCDSIYLQSDRTPDNEGNLADFKHEMDAHAAKHAKARKPELYVKDIEHEAVLAREYCEVMCIPAPSWALLPKGIEAGAAMTAALRVHAEEVSHV